MQKLSKKNNFQLNYPDLAKEWHPTKNGDLTPENVTYGSGYKAWWLCSKGHDFVSGVYSRTGKNKNGCPYCSGKKTLNYDLFEKLK